MLSSLLSSLGSGDFDVFGLLVRARPCVKHPDSDGNKFALGSMDARLLAAVRAGLLPMLVVVCDSKYRLRPLLPCQDPGKKSGRDRSAARGWCVRSAESPPRH